MPNYTPGNDRFIPRNLKLKVGPIRDPKHIEAIRKILEEEDCRMLAFFDLAINNGLRSCDLCNLKVEQVKGKPVNSEIIIIESKTGKENYLVLTKKAHQSINAWLRKSKLKDSDYLFKSRFGGPLQSATIGDKLQQLCKRVGIKDVRIGSHTSRKTWGYHQHKNGTSLPVIMIRFNHTNQKITLNYLSLQDKDVKQAIIESEL
jgi:integrase